MAHPPLYLNRYLASLAVQGQPEFLDFLAEVRPQLVQMGFYCPQLYGLADIPEDQGPQWAGGYPMSLPVVGLRANLDWQRAFNRRVHELDGRVIGHFSMTLAWGNPEGRTGFFDFYDHLWPSDLLGEKPVERVEDLLQQNPDGSIHLGDRWGFPRTAGCSNNPHWRDLHRRMVEVAIDYCQVDGFMTCYNYHFGCTCPHCHTAFRTYLSERYTPAQMGELFGIADLDAFVLDGTLGRVTGWVDPASPHPPALQIEAMRFAQLAWKKHYDEIFIATGRRLKPDLILGSWNHLGDMQVGQDERNVMPLEEWGRDEDLFWYSTGAHVGTVADGDLGHRMLNALWIGDMTGGKMPIQGHYESTRVRASIAEGWATRGPGMGLYCGWRDPVGRRAYRDYFDFARRWEDHFHPVESAAEVGLVFPRRALLLAGDDEPVDTFRRAGEQLLDQHVLFDVLLDERLDAQRLSAYRAVILPQVHGLSPAQLAALQSWADQGGALLALGTSAGLPDSSPRLLPADDLTGLVAALRESAPDLTRIAAPRTIHCTAYRQPGRLLLHLVNFDREEGDEKGPSNEKPIAAADIAVDLPLPPGPPPHSIDFLSPDEGYMRAGLNFAVSDNRLRFRIPGLLVYGLLVVRTDEGS